MKKIKILSLISVLFISIFALTSCGRGVNYSTDLYEYYFINSEEVFILGYLAKDDSSITKISLPEKVTIDDKNYCVKSIGEGAFIGCTALTSITIPSSVTSIGWCAFYVCTALTITFELTQSEANSQISFGLSWSFDVCAVKYKDS